MSEHAVRENIVKWGKSLFDRGLTAGSSGNISVGIEDGYLATPQHAGQISGSGCHRRSQRDFQTEVTHAEILRQSRFPMAGSAAA